MPRNLFSLKWYPTSIRAQLLCFFSSKVSFHGHGGSPQHPSPNRFTFPSLLKDAASVQDLNHGRVIHATVLEMGLQSDSFVASSLVNMYAKCGSLEDAAHAFDSLPQRDSTLWNAMISGYFQHGHFCQGFSYFRCMQMAGSRPDGYSISIALGACSDCLDLEHGEEIHGYVVRNVSDPDTFLSTTLIDMYAKCGQVGKAYKVFERTPQRNAYVWNTMIGGFCQNGFWEKSLELFVLMKDHGCRVESATYSSILMACSSGGAAYFGGAVHAAVLKTGFELDPYFCTSLLALHSKCGLIDDAFKLFRGVPNRGIELWNSMITAYVGSGRADEAFGVYIDMRYSGIEPDSFTISNVLSACAMIGHCELARCLHGILIKRPDLTNMAVQSSLLTMYSKCGNIEDSIAVFNSLDDRDAIVWGSMIAGLYQNKRFKEALVLFKQMEVQGLKKDSAIMATAISACVRSEFTGLGCQIHGSTIKTGTGSDVFVGCALLDLYAKAGLLELAENIFSSMNNKNLVAFNTMISGYSHNGQFNNSITTFAQISQHGLTPDSVSMVNALVAISSLAAPLKGKMVHGFQTRNEIAADVQASNALLDMYIKCGCLRYAQHIFMKMSSRNIQTWNSMIGGLGSHGRCLEAISLLEEMLVLGVRPDDITFLALISSCSHSGFVEEGLRIFNSMTGNFGIEPWMEHYANVVDLLGRAGHLDEAYKFIQSMPFEPDSSVWQSFLHASRACKNIEFGEVAADHLQKLEAERSGHDMQLINLYGEAGLLDKAANVRVGMRSKGLRKNPGCSWIEVRNNVELFFSGDSSSHRTTEIHDTLKSLTKNLKDEDFSPCGVLT